MSAVRAIRHNRTLTVLRDVRDRLRRRQRVALAGNTEARALYDEAIDQLNDAINAELAAWGESTETEQ